MRYGVFFMLFLAVCIYSIAQKSHYDSISKVLKQDSIEYQEQLKDIDRVKRQTDSIIQKELGHTERITPGPDSATVIKNLRALAEKEIQKQQEEDSKNYYFFVGAFVILLLTVIIIFKRKDFSKEVNKKP